ncbi:MAG: hemolysin family protein [Phycisphaerae bacterium]
MTFSLLLWIFFAGLVATLLFSTVSYALRIASRVKLEEALDTFRRSAALDDILDKRFDLALSAAVLRLISNVVVILTAGWYFFLQSPDSSPLRAFGWTIVLAVPALLIVSVAIPQAWAKYAGEHLLAMTWPLLRVTYVVLYPLIRVMNVFDEIVRRLAGVSIAEDSDTAAADAVEQEILSVVAEGTAEGTVDEEQKKMIEGVISFRDLQVGQIMTPRTEIVALDVNTPVLEVRDKIVKEGLSRVPLFEGTLDNVVGILYAKDLLAFLEALPPPGASGAGEVAAASRIDVRKVMRPPLFVPRTKPLRDLLREFRIGQVHMAVVLDEYGGTSGLVTTEDILEEIVGDIADEYERPEAAEVKKIDERTMEVDARIHITELNRALSLNFPEDGEFQTLGGFVISQLGVIPPKGEVVTHEGVTITVLDAEPRRVKKLKVELPEEEAGEAVVADEDSTE